MRYILTLFITFLFTVVISPFVVNAETVLDAHKYAWSDRSGYINFANVVVGDSALSGFAWSANHGWIKLNPTQSGVSNDGEGNLSGYAWGEQLGWIDFSGVRISSNGRFSGTATGDLVGTITFDCPTYCDVQTDWTYDDDQTLGVSGNRVVVPPREMAIVNELLSPLPTTSAFVNPDEFKTIVQHTPSGDVVLLIPLSNFFEGITFFIQQKVAPSDTEKLLQLNVERVSDGIFEVFAKDQNGNLVRSFPSPITITLPIPKNLYGTQELGVYWLNEDNYQWVLIPDAIFSEESVTFQVNHLTKFAIFATINGEKSKPVIPVFERFGTTIPTSSDLLWIVPLIIGLLSLCLAFLEKEKQKNI